jgi:hypothetical protein
LGGTTAAARNVISGNSGDGVLLDSAVTGASVQGNYIGTDATGAKAIANSVGVEVAGSGNVVGGSIAGARNVISGNSKDGVLVDSTASGTTVQGNFMGLVAAGNAALANGTNGVELQSVNNTVGGTSFNARNYIAGNKNDGVLVDSGASGNQVLGNFIGLDYSGKVALGNSNGVEVAGTNNTLGGTASGARNVIAGNSTDGVLLDGTASGTAVQGNYIGTDLTGASAVANGVYGVSIAGSNNTIGGSSAAASNTIADNKSGGVQVSAGSGNTIRRNALFANGPSNTGPGIVLASGTNNSITSPTISSATLSGSTLTVKGTYTAPTANVSYVLEFFANPTGDAEGKIYLGSLTVTPTSTGSHSFSFTVTTTVTGTDPLITATLTDATGDTSAFSTGVTVT